MNRRGYTLIELMVVIVLISVMMAFVLPALNTGRERSQGVVCQMNLKQNAMALQTFAQSSNHFPYGFASKHGFSTQPPGNYIGDATFDWQGWWWFHQLGNPTHPRHDKALLCPSQKHTDNLLRGHYGTNTALLKLGDFGIESEFYGTPLRPEQVRNAGRTLLLVDSGYILISRLAVESAQSIRFDNPKRLGSFYLPGLTGNTNRLIDTDRQHDAFRGRHPGRSVNTAFADGHVETVSADYLQAKRPSDDSVRMFIWSP